MSLLPAAMQIKDDMPMTLGQAVKRALDPSTPVDSIRAFECGNHTPDGQVWIYFPNEPEQKTLKREPTMAEMPEALRQYVGECCTEAIRADDEWIGAGVMVIEGGPKPYRAKVTGQVLSGIFKAREMRLLPSPKQEGGWVEHKGGECPISNEVAFRYRCADGDEQRANAPAGAYGGMWTWRCDPPHRIVAYMVLPE